MGLPLVKSKTAYRDLAKVWHPDRFTADPRLQERASEMMKRINWAYETLQSQPKKPAPAGFPHATTAKQASATAPVASVCATATRCINETTCTIRRFLGGFGHLLRSGGRVRMGIFSSGQSVVNRHS